VFEAAERGDQDALLALDEVGQVLALGIATTVAILDPSLVVLGGGVGSQPALVRSGQSRPAV
jgi:predicted NBD/HSP70 family sugar kinase